MGAILHIYGIFTKNIITIFPHEHIITREELEQKFITDILIINDLTRHKQKMDNLKIEFKGSISYQQCAVQKSEKYMKRQLVMHGGRAPEEMKRELEVYQETKNKKVEVWIDTQSSQLSTYSKSRVLYHPNPSKVYQTNDVIRLARK